MEQKHQKQKINSFITCPNCKTKFQQLNKIYNKCINCMQNFFHFCHQLPYAQFQYIQCQKCDKQYYCFFCVKCKKLLVFTNYRMGSVFTCECGFQSCYINCGSCNQAQCLPPERRYQGIRWICKNCNKKYSFVTCQNCLKPIYNQKNEIQREYKCKNKQCLKVNIIKECKRCKFNFSTCSDKEICFNCKEIQKQQQKEKNIWRNNSNVSNSTSVNFTEKYQESLCKICLEKQAQYINTKCFHLSACQTCVQSLKNICPICRKAGQYHKVFK